MYFPLEHSYIFRHRLIDDIEIMNSLKLVVSESRSVQRKVSIRILKMLLLCRLDTAEPQLCSFNTTLYTLLNF